MAPLSKELSGLILPHDHYGTHLNNKAQTIDNELELKNFAHAGHALAEVWSQIMFDGFPVVCEYVNPEKSTIDMNKLQEKDLSWQKTHVRSSQYLLQIVKCKNTNCCTPFRSSLEKVLPNRFLPPPVQINQSEDGLCFSTNSGHYAPLFLLQTLIPTLQKEFKDDEEIPYDYSCPSIKKDITKKTCKKCKIYFASITYLKEHEKCCAVVSSLPKIRPVRIAAKRRRELLAIISNEEEQEYAEWLDEDMVDTDYVSIPSFESSKECSAPVFSVEDHLTCPWE